MGQLRLLLLIYVRPRRAMSEIIDEGSLLFGLAGIVGVWLLTSAALYEQVAPAYAPFIPRAQPQAGRAAPPGSPAADPDEGVAVDPDTGEMKATGSALTAATFMSATLTGASVLAMIALYAPFTLLMATIFEPIGSFGVAFRRDFGPFLACLLFAWTAARLPVALAALLTGNPLAAIALWLLSLAYFTILAAVACHVVLGIGRGAAFGAASVGWLALLLTPFIGFVASPFILYYAYQYFRGDVGDVLGSFGARQSFKRYLAAATINPRDADAHYQLGLIHLQRRQLDEAADRFARAVAIDPRELDAHYQLGRLARQQGRFEEARQHFDAVVTRDERHASHEVWREIGATYLESDSFEHAKWALEKFVAARPHDPEGLYRLGAARQRLGDAAGAQEMFARAIEAVDTMPRYLQRKAGPWRKMAASAVSGERAPRT